MDLFSGAAGRKKEGRAGPSSNQGHIPLFRPHRATTAPPSPSSLFEPLSGLTAFWCETSRRDWSTVRNQKLHLRCPKSVLAPAAK